MNIAHLFQTWGDYLSAEVEEWVGKEVERGQQTHCCSSRAVSWSCHRHSLGYMTQVLGKVGYMTRMLQ